MNNNDIAWWFAILGLYNTQIGLSNINKNTEAEERAKRIEEKLDKVLKLLGDNAYE